MIIVPPSTPIDQNFLYLTSRFEAVALSDLLRSGIFRQDIATVNRTVGIADATGMEELVTEKNKVKEMMGRLAEAADRQ